MENNQLLKYKNYVGSINIDPENNLLYGKVENIDALITFEAENTESLKEAFEAAVDDYLQLCERKRIQPEGPFA
jgi:predicted HicB family RNase H-like nuclease